MVTRSLLATLVALSASGCILVSTPRSPGDVTFTWTFSGQSCAQAGVNTVAISIPGQTLANGGVFACLSNNYPGIVLQNFRAGSYSYTIEGRGFANELRYQRTGSFVIDGNVTESVDLLPVSTGANTYAYLTWTFPPNSLSSNPDCTQAGVTDVMISIDGAAETQLSCAAGFNTTGVQTPMLAAGTHTISLRAVNSTGYEYYGKVSTLTTSSAGPVSAAYSLDWTVGGAALKWTLVDGSVTRTCAQAGVVDVYVNFQDTTTNDFLYPGSGDKQPCSASEVKYDFLKPGNYRVVIQAAGPSNALYTSNTVTPGPPVITIGAGVFVPLANATNVVMYRTQ